MKKIILSNLILIALHFGAKAQDFPLNYIGMTKQKVIESFKKKFPEMEFSEEETRSGEKFISYFKRKTGAMIDLYFRGREEVCYLSSFITREIRDYNLVSAYIDEFNIQIVPNVWITTDRSKKIIMKKDDDLDTYTIEVSYLTVKR